MKRNDTTLPLNKDARLATWNAYHNMAEVLCIEEAKEWREMTVADIIALVAEALREAQA